MGETFINYLIIELIKIEGKYSNQYNSLRHNLCSYRMLIDISDKLYLARDILGNLIKYKDTENLYLWVDRHSIINKVLFPAEREFLEKELIPLIEKYKIQSRNSKLKKV